MKNTNISIPFSSVQNICVPQQKQINKAIVSNLVSKNDAYKICWQKMRTFINIQVEKALGLETIAMAIEHRKTRQSAIKYVYYN